MVNRFKPSSKAVKNAKPKRLDAIETDEGTRNSDSPFTHEMSEN